MSNLPARGVMGPLSARAQAYVQANRYENELAAGVSSGFAVVSIRGKNWRIKKGGEETVVKRQDDGSPASYIDVVIVKSASTIAKIFYEKGYNPDDNSAPPDCFSTNGVTPDASVAKKQFNVCATCPQNNWGSRITPAGKKGKACQDSKRLAILPIGDLDNAVYGGPMLLRIPPASLSEMATWAKKLEAMGYPYFAVCARLRFADAEFPQVVFDLGDNPLTGNPSLNDEQFAKIEEWRASDVVQRILSDVVDELGGAPAHALAPSGFDKLPPRAAVAAPVAAPVPVTPPVTPTVEVESPQVAALKAQLAALQAQQVAPVPAPAPEAPKPVEVAPTLAPASAPAPTTQAEVSFDDALAQLLGD